MKRNSISLSCRAAAVALLCVIWLGGPARVAGQVSVAPDDLAPDDQSQVVAGVGPGSTIVHSQYGGQIFGFDIDQNGTEGVLSEMQDLGGGKVLAAVETFDRTTGKILKVVQKLETKHNLSTYGFKRKKLGMGKRAHLHGS